MKQISLECETITPLFWGGADGRVVELRPPALKGILRFWWRAIRAFTAGYREKEAQIFGGGHGNKVKSAFTIRLDGQDVKNNSSLDKLPAHHNVKGHKLNILEYLAYGTYDYKKGEGNIFNRPYIKPGYKFRLLIDLKGDMHCQDELLEALQVFFLFGALGARSRNGFGNIALTDSNPSEYKQKLMALPEKELIEKYLTQKEKPDFTAFSSHCKLFKTIKEYDTWDACLAALGFAYRECRLSLPLQERQYIGAPLIDQASKRNIARLERHAKPYFLRVHRTKNNRYTGYILYLPSLYCTGLSGNAAGESINQQFAGVCTKLNNELARRLEVVI
ncbi:type III-B CRISPR module RAMP protein Cmr1 [Desulfurispora thermophila]|uniref:type III-B CRISPR module RAMP protein Cmr1 n=1 Tax=Desulfurispora thermophila TaxID=265470 RepID=UPI000370ECFA|nr:type III-B CRISPR module RAMP protein Cmr1 [Desulfurispora thermophila]